MSTLKELKKNLAKDSSSLPPVRMALLGDSATQLLATALRGTAWEHGVRLELFEADFNQVERQLLDPTSELHRFAPDHVLLFQSTHKLLARHAGMDPAVRARLAQERLRFVEDACAGRSWNVLCFNYPEIDDAVHGSFANRVESSFPWQVRKLNLGLMELSARVPNLLVVDLAAVQNRIGRDAMFSPEVYAGTEMVLSVDALPEVAARAMDVVSALRGRVRKCVVLDLDNTLWGGVIGDDGVERIQLGHGLGLGKVFVEFQQWLKKLKERGIVLAVCSKNDEAVAKEPFLRHPDMVLRLDDIAVFVANWENKADNIRRIRDVLNIGLDSMVFLDDNPFERNIVRENLPDVLVPELPEDPAGYLEHLYSLNLFETASASRADADRTRQYQEAAIREREKSTFVDEASYLRSLDMVSEVSGFDAFNTPRVAQLSQRSNQFNLRTVRWSESDVERLGRDPGHECFAFTLEDRFGDNGLICVVALRRESTDELFVENWFMSCRVLKRGMEDFVLQALVSRGREVGARRIVGEHVPTEKNAMVRDHYAGLGFTPQDRGDGRSLWALDLDTAAPRPCHITRKERSEP